MSTRYVWGRFNVISEDYFYNDQDRMSTRFLMTNYNGSGFVSTGVKFAKYSNVNYVDGAENCTLSGKENEILISEVGPYTFQPGYYAIYQNIAGNNFPDPLTCVCYFRFTAETTITFSHDEEPDSQGRYDWEGTVSTTGQAYRHSIREDTRDVQGSYIDNVSGPSQGPYPSCAPAVSGPG